MVRGSTWGPPPLREKYLPTRENSEAKPGQTLPGMVYIALVLGGKPAGIARTEGNLRSSVRIDSQGTNRSLSYWVRKDPAGRGPSGRRAEGIDTPQPSG